MFAKIPLLDNVWFLFAVGYVLGLLSPVLYGWIKNALKKKD